MILSVPELSALDGFCDKQQQHEHEQKLGVLVVGYLPAGRAENLLTRQRQRVVHWTVSTWINSHATLIITIHCRILPKTDVSPKLLCNLTLTTFRGVPVRKNTLYEQTDLLETKSLFHFQTSPPTGHLHFTSLDSKSYIGKNGKIDKSADFRPGSKCHGWFTVAWLAALPEKLHELFLHRQHPIRVFKFDSNSKNHIW